ncbi:MAG: alpha-2-macroglobulin, partial [Methylotenera sp.]
MQFLKSVFQLLRLIFTQISQILGAALGFIFGSIQYQAPAWLKWCVAKLLSLRIAINRKPIQSLGIIALVAALGAGVWQTYAWYQSRPQPVTTKVVIKAPTRTVIEENLPPNPLLINFDHSVAPIALVGKKVSEGIDIMPKIEGEWKWITENDLSFTPKADWPVGMQYRVNFNAKAFTPKTELENWDAEFTSPVFVAAITSSEFYQDPINPAMKKVVVNLNFSHPVDTAKLEKSITLKMRTAKAGLLDFGNDAISFVISYDKFKLNAYIHSAPLNIPKDDSVLEVTIDKDLKAARGGKPFETALTQSVNIPGLYSLLINDVSPTVVSNAQNEPEQILVLNASAAVHEKEIASHVKAWVLPRNKLNSTPEELKYPHI